MTGGGRGTAVLEAAGLGAAAYLAAMLAVALLALAGGAPPAPALVAPVVILVSLGVALVLVSATARRDGVGSDAFGFCAAPRGALVRAGLVGLAGGVVLRGVSLLAGISPGAALPGLAPWQVVALFWVAAPVQEEVIFRGLVQYRLERSGGTVALGLVRLSWAGLVAATLFAAVHLMVAGAGATAAETAFTVAGAFALGLAAGELRWRSGSLLPAVIVHALFNVGVS